MRLPVRAWMLAFLVMGATPAVAHNPGPLDLNTLVFDNLWEIFGPPSIPATSTGGAATASSSHHGDATNTMVVHQCGDPGVTINTGNPFVYSDLGRGVFEASGRFFVDWELTGPKAGQVDRFEFGFLHSFPWTSTAQLSQTLCTGPFPLPGVFYEFYRGDNNGADGWETPVNTLLVPDMAYGAVVRALDLPPGCTVPGCAITLKVGFVYANVNNHLSDEEYKPAVPATCPPDAVGQITCPHHETTPPYPQVKGALGRARNPNCQGITAEYGELLTSFSASSGTVTEIASTPRDVDPVLLLTVSAQVWGPTYCITGAGFPLTFTAVDSKGNIGIRTI